MMGASKPPSVLGLAFTWGVERPTRRGTMQTVVRYLARVSVFKVLLPYLAGTQPSAWLSPWSPVRAISGSSNH